jgi:NADH dehydrogenase FAD-containing subunit
VLLGCRIRSYEGALPPPRPDGQVEADLIVLATGVAPPRAAPSVPALAPGEGTDGGLWTGHHLSSPSDGCTFDGGDSASFRGQGLTRLGVFAIRQGAGAVPQPSGLLRGKPWKCPARLTATLKRRID